MVVAQRRVDRSNNATAETTWYKWKIQVGSTEVSWSWRKDAVESTTPRWRALSRGGENKRRKRRGGRTNIAVGEQCPILENNAWCVWAAREVTT